MQAIEKSVLVNLKRNLQAILQCIGSFRTILYKEEKAVIAHDLHSIEMLAKEKKYQATLIEQLLKNSGEISKAMDISVEEKEFGTLSGMKDVLSDCLKIYDQEKIGDLSYREFLGANISLIVDVLDEFREFKPLVEKNRLVLSKLLYNHQQSYQFWCELSTESDSQYDAHGVKKGKETISQLSVKA